MAIATDKITDPGEYVTRFIENIEQSHFTAAMEMVSEDCEYDNVPITKVFGREAMIQILSDFLAAATKVTILTASPSPRRSPRNRTPLAYCAEHERIISEHAVRSC
jgi:hypothetical protein